MPRCLSRWLIVFILLCENILPFEHGSTGQYIPVYYNADNVEILFYQSGELEKVKLEGNVKIAFEDITIRCETAEFKKNTGDIYADGSILVETSQGTIEADSISYNLNSKTGIILNAAFSSPPFFGKAEKVERKGDVFYLINGYITTCDFQKPHYRISASRIKYVSGEYYQAERLKFILGERFSIFYFPRYTVDMKTKEPIVTATLGYTSKAGENLEVVFTQRAGDNTNAVVKERILIGEKGVGGGAGINSKVEKYRVDGFLYKGWDSEDIEPALFLEFLKNYTSFLGEGAVLLDWRWIDNNNMFYNFFHNDYMAKSKRYNYFSYTHNFTKGILNLNFRDSARDEFLNIEKLPEVRFYIPPSQIENTSLFAENDFRITNFYKEDKNYLRVMDILTLKGYKQTERLTFSPYISVGGFEYSEEDDEKFNFFREAGIKISTLLKKEHRNFTEYFSPSLIFFNRELDYGKEELVSLDDMERMEEGNFLGLDMDWFFKNENDYVGNITLRNLYDIDRDKLGLSSLRYDIKLTPSLYIEGKNEWDLSEGNYVFGVNDIIFESGRYRYSIGNRYDDESNISGIEGKLSQIINERWKYSTGIQYDFNSETVSRISLDVWHRLHCWELNIGVSGNRDDISIFIMIYPFI